MGRQLFPRLLALAALIPALVMSAGMWCHAPEAAAKSTIRETIIPAPKTSRTKAAQRKNRIASAKTQSAKKTSRQSTPSKKPASKSSATKAKASVRGDLKNQQSNLTERQKSIQGELTSIKQDIEKKQERMNEATNDLKLSEKAISDSNRTLKELGEKKEQVENRLSDLAREAKIVGGHVKDAEELIGVISNAQFMNTRRHPWQSALEGGNPNDVARLTAVLGYMAIEEHRTVERLENRQKNIEAVRQKTAATRQELVRIERDEEKNRQKLQHEKTLRERAVGRLRQEITSQKERYEQLVKNEAQLSDLIANLDRRIAADEKAEREREARRLAAEERAAKAAREAEKQSGKRVAARPSSGKDDPRRTTSAPTIGNFGSLKGRLTLPTRGQIAARFGQKRAGAASSLSWRGLLIRAPQGQNVVAAAPGTVVFSDWMRGFGNLLIVDHGSNYLSVYANNETLYKQVGSRVRQGETIASVGSSGGEDQPGLYFELRYKGKPFNPEGWLAR